MPNLELFANAGFPFTQFADLSQTTVILPDTPSAEEISLYLHLMSHFGVETGYPALRVTVAGPNTAISKARDYLVVGTIANQPAFRSLDSLLPVTFDFSGIHVKQAPHSVALLSSVELSVSNWWSRLVGSPEETMLAPDVSGSPDALIEQIESPSSAGRSIVLVELKENSDLDTFAGTFLEKSQSRDITDSVSLLRNGKFDSYPLNGPSYHVGDITWFAMMRIWLTQNFVLLLLVVTALSFLIGLWIRQWLSLHAHERLKLAEKANATV
jgi:cellulose synthase (UDP-forming)